MRSFLLFLLLSVLCLCSAAGGNDAITADQAKNYIGETKTVIGQVVSAKYAAGSRGKPTFLNLDKPYPNQIFTVVIWGSNRSKFDEPPEKHFLKKKVRVTGKISEYRGKPQIVVTDPKQINIKEKEGVEK
ncbi:MAG: DNA-binding protein [Candidatus Glassbacteria bacterium]|nr:DNA-binding protein [Candidatus Glassbacteria bacterium]